MYNPLSKGNVNKNRKQRLENHQKKLVKTIFLLQTLINCMHFDVKNRFPKIQLLYFSRQVGNIGVMLL